MDATEFQRVYAAFEEFHSFFAPAFGRKQRRERGRNYLQALLVQSQERRNAENLSESVGVSARALQRFLTDSRWRERGHRPPAGVLDTQAHPEAVWVHGSDFPKQGRKLVLRAPGENCQSGMFLAYVTRWDGLWWTSGCTWRAGLLTAAGRRRECQPKGGNTGRRRSWLWRCYSGPWSAAI